ncbi:MAG: NADH-quinone oxidoreductase subunit L [Bacteroidales bacterium]|nr:NADH-quinone oxidoreductase subunit L [Bacteroidales bacterium]
MMDWLWTIPALPFAGFLILALFGKQLSRKVVAWTGSLSTGLSALITIIVGISFLTNPPGGHVFKQILWSWIEVGSFSPEITLYLDSLSLVFMFVITFVGFLIHLYSTGFMVEEEGYARFFSYMNLFVGSMLLLVMAGNLVFLYLGWEAVGLCSYLLIGFWYKNPDNGYAARKAFIVTRIGDTLMAIGLFLLFDQFGTLQIQEILTRFPAEVAEGSPFAVATAIMLLGGAVGKSAQLPLQVWLPDAMAGPSPVSALIHAATMVTAGVYLIARTFVIFQMAPVAQTIVAIVGAVTLLLAGFSALTQRDIKRVLAYSTISQIGYMFLALGVGAWSAAVFHFMTHAFFKALLFLGAGVVIMHLHHEHNMFKMGGLRKSMPFTFWVFLIGSASLAALPLITAGFYSKDIILWYAWAAEGSHELFWLAGILGSLLTAVYTSRMVFITFFGEIKTEPHGKTALSIKIPLIVLAVLSLIGGFINFPGNFGDMQWLSGFLANNLPEAHAAVHDKGIETLFQVISAVLVLLGIYLAYLLYLKRNVDEQFSKKGIYHYWFSGWGFDYVYEVLVIKPVVWLSKIDEHDFIEYFYTGIARFHMFWHVLFSKLQTGKIRWYAMGIATGAIVAIIVLVFS